MQVPECDAYFLGMRRSGNHALLDWILPHHKTWIHYNNAILKNGVLSVDENQIVTEGKADYIGEYHYSLASVEDYDLKAVKEYVGDDMKIILLRDPFNLFASRLQMARNFVNDPDSKFTCFDLISSRAIQLWKQYASEFVFEHVKNTVFLNFNFWFESAEYRKDISRTMCWKHTDEGYGSENGWVFSGGSSFGQKAKVLESWKNFENDEEYLSLFDVEVLHLHKLLFGEPPKLNLDLKSGMHKQVEQLLQPVYDLVDAGRNATAREIAIQLAKVCPGSTQVQQVSKALQRGCFDMQRV